MTDLIKRDDALALCDRYPYVEGVKSALEDLPAVGVGEPVAHAYIVDGECEQIEWGADYCLPDDPALTMLYALTPVMPAIDPAAIREAALLDAGYDTTLTDRIEELVKEGDMLRDFDDHFRSMCGFKRDGRSSIECFDDFLAGINKQDIPLPFDHFLQVQKERDEALAKLAKAVEMLILCGDMFDEVAHPSDPLSVMIKTTLAELEGK